MWRPSSLLVLLAACQSSSGPDVRAPGDRLAIEVAPLAYDDVDEVRYRLTVSAPTVGLVWTEDVSSVDFGDGRGGLTYIGPCDASAGTHDVALVILTIRAGGVALVDGVDFVNPAPAGDPLVRQAPCAPNADTLVAFDLTVMRSARQGFFDVAVTFDDIYCSAKLDCESESGAPLTLLHHPHSGERELTAVLALACWSGAAATELHMDPIRIRCTGASDDVVIDPHVAGNHDPAFGPAPNTTDLLFQSAAYTGQESIPDPSTPKRYLNVAMGLNALAFPALGTCTLTARATASESTDPSFPAGYPVIDWDVPLVEGGALACERYPLFSEEVATHYLDAPFTFGGGAPPPPAPATWSFEVRDAHGAAIAGATVTASGVSDTTDADGLATLVDLAPGPTRARVSAPGHAPIVSELDLPPGATAGTVERLAPWSEPEEVDPDEGHFTSIDGVTLEIPPGALLDGGAPAASATLAIAAPASAPGAIGVVPGPLATVTGQALSPITLADVTLTGPGGEALTIAPGEALTLTLPLPPELDAAAEAGTLVPTVASLDPQTGRWRIEEVVGAHAPGEGWRFTLPHLSWWGLFLAYPEQARGCVEVAVVAAEDSAPLEGATVYAIDPAAPVPGSLPWSGASWVARATTDEDGRACLPVPRGRELRVTARAAFRPFEIDGPTLVTAPPLVEGHCPIPEVSTTGGGATPSEGCVSATVRLAGAYCVRGRVRYHTGQTVAGRSVRFVGDTFLGPISHAVTTAGDGTYCVPQPERLMSAHASDDAGTDHVSSFLVDPGPIYDAATCDAGTCGAAPDIVLPDVAEPVSCLVGAAFQDDGGAVSGLEGPLPAGTPIYLFGDEPTPGCAATPDWHCTTAPAAWGDLLATTSVTGAEGGYRIDLAALGALPPEATLLAGGCAYAPGLCQCPNLSTTGVWLDDAPRVVGPGDTLCADLGVVGIHQFCPF